MVLYMVFFTYTFSLDLPSNSVRQIFLHPCFTDEDLEAERLGYHSGLQNGEVAEAGLQCRFPKPTFYTIFTTPPCLTETFKTNTQKASASPWEQPLKTKGDRIIEDALSTHSPWEISATQMTSNSPQGGVLVCISSPGIHPELQNKTATLPSGCPTKPQIQQVSCWIYPLFPHFLSTLHFWPWSEVLPSTQEAMPEAWKIILDISLSTS